jgi:hypothetical protein
LWNFWIKYFHLICHLILTIINCITLKIHSKADFKSKSQNIWQQIILFSCTVMQMICTWPKIWTLLGRLSLLCTVQLMKKMSDASKNIFRVYHIKIIAPKKMVHTTWNRQIPQYSLSGMCAHLPQHPWLFIFSSWSEQNNRKVISLHNNGEDNKHAHGLADF